MRTSLILLCILLSSCRPLFPTVVTWQTPLLRENGNSLYPYELEGYVVTVEEGGVVKRYNTEETYLVFIGLTEGTYTFYVQTIDTEGLVSDPSDRIKKVI